MFVCVFICVCVCARARACVRACVRARVSMYACARAGTLRKPILGMVLFLQVVYLKHRIGWATNRSIVMLLANPCFA